MVDDDFDYTPREPVKNPPPIRVPFYGAVTTTGKPEDIYEEIGRLLDHAFRGRFTLRRGDGSPVEFDPVLHDGEPPPGYEPRGMPVVDHRQRDAVQDFRDYCDAVPGPPISATAPAHRDRDLGGGDA